MWEQIRMLICKCCDFFVKRPGAAFSSVSKVVPTRSMAFWGRIFTSRRRMGWRLSAMQWRTGLREWITWALRAIGLNRLYLAMNGRGVYLYTISSGAMTLVSTGGPDGNSGVFTPSAFVGGHSNLLQLARLGNLWIGDDPSDDERNLLFLFFTAEIGRRPTSSSKGIGNFRIYIGRRWTPMAVRRVKFPQRRGDAE